MSFSKSIKVLEITTVPTLRSVQHFGKRKLRKNIITFSTLKICFNLAKISKHI